MTNNDQELYHELANLLALNTFSRCVLSSNGYALYEHFNENHLGVAPDILARLGVMRPVGQNRWFWPGRHEFIRRWMPSDPFMVARHDGAPTIFDLIVATCLLVDWDSQYMPDNVTMLEVPSVQILPEIDISDERRFTSEPQLQFTRRVFLRAAAVVEQIWLGHWRPDGVFELISAIYGQRPIDLADTYAQTRNLTAKRLGDVELLFPPTSP